MSTDHECQLKLVEQEEYSKPMPWIGLYIAVASLVCTLAMAADIFHGFRLRKFWFPCKYFTLNAASLTVIAVAMKLPVDLNNSMPRDADQLSKLSSTTFMCTMLANFMPSLGPMSNSELLSNVIALGILVITVAVNICIQISTHVIVFFVPFHVLNVIIMLSLLVILVSSALTVPESKKLLEIKYHEMRKRALNEDSEQSGKSISIVFNLTQRVSKYWIMAETGSPQFVVACSPTFSACGAMCLFLAFYLITYVAIYLPSSRSTSHNGDDESDYKWSIIPIVLIQSVGVLVSTIAPVFRWFSALTFKLSLKWSKSNLKVYVVEKYWTQKLVDLKGDRVPVHISSRTCERSVYDIRNLLINILIGFQVIIVVACKVIRLMPIFFVIIVVYFWHFYKWLKRNLITNLIASSNPNGSESEQDASKKLDLSPYVLQLQDEVELANRTLRSISKSVNRLIQRAGKQQPNSLKKLLEKSTGFKGVTEFDSDRVPILHPEEAPNCWSLVVVTLTSIAIALPNMRNGMIDLILGAVREGLSYVSLVEETLYDSKGNMAHTVKAANSIWFKVELYRKWLDNNLHESAHKGKTSKEVLEWLGDRAKNIVMELGKTKIGGFEDASLQKFIAANSMYRISQSILLDYESRYRTDEMLLEQISIMIADILGACLTNLPHVITMKCYSDTIEKRERSVRVAARILGETKGILEILQSLEHPSLNPDQMATIDGWRAVLVKHLSTSHHDSISPNSDELVKISVM